MKTKKILSGLLAIILAFSMIPATAIAAESEYPILDALGIEIELKDTDGITRYELAKIVIDIAKLEIVSEGKAVYADVPETHWAFAEINTVTVNGYMSGLTNMTFKPNSKASVADVAQVLLNLLGYGNFGVRAGWTTADYLWKAKNIGLLKGVSSFGDSITASTLKQMVVNMLEENIVTISSVGTDGAQYEIDSEMTYLESNYGYYFKDGIMQAAGKSTIMGSNPIPKGKIKVNGVIYDAGDKDYSEFLGYEVRIIVDKDEENANVVYVEKLRDYNESEIYMTASDIDDYSNLKYTYKAEDGSIETANISISSQIFVNGQKAAFNENLMKPLSGSVKLMDSDGDEVYDMVYITYEVFYEVAGAFKDEYITDAISGDTLEIDGKEFLIYENGIAAGMSAIQNESIIAVMPGALSFDANGLPSVDNDLLTRASVETGIEAVAGTVSAKSASGCVVGETEYTYSKYFTKLVAAGKADMPELNTYVVLYLNSEDQVVYAKIDTDAMIANKSDKYGYIIKANSARGESGKVVVKIFTEDATFISGETPEKIKINGHKKDADKLFDNTTLFPAQDGVLDTQLITFETDENGVISAINTVTDYTATTPYEGYDVENFSKEYQGSIQYFYTFGHLYTINDNTRLFEIPEDLEDEKKYKITTGSKVLANNKTYYVELYDTDEQYNIATIVMDYNKMAENGKTSENKTLTYSHSSGEINSFVVTDKNIVMNEDGEEVTELTGLTYTGTPANANKMEIKKIVATEDDLRDKDSGSFGHIYSKYLNTKWSDLEPGDVIHYKLGDDGYVDIFRLVFKQEDIQDESGNPVYAIKGHPTAAAFLVSGVIHKVYSDGNFLFRSSAEKTSTSIHKARPVTSQMNQVKIFIYEDGKARQAESSELRPEDKAMFICEYGRLYEVIVYR